MNASRGLSPTAAGIVFALLVPLPATVIIPWLITRWTTQPPLLGIVAGRPLGAAMVAVGAVLLFSGLAWFAHEGVKPYPPIERVVTTGPYAYTRNPMYSGVVLLSAGQGLLFGSRGLVLYALCWFALFWVFERTIDDPFITKRMGKEYEDYLKNVPGWIPRRPRHTEQVPSQRVARN